MCEKYHYGPDMCGQGVLLPLLKIAVNQLVGIIPTRHTQGIIFPDDVDRVLDEEELNANDTCGSLTNVEIVNEVNQDLGGETLASDQDELDESPDEPTKKPCSYAQALLHMEELKLYASSTQGPESDEMYAVI